MKVSSVSPTKAVVDHVLYGGLVVSQDYGPHLVNWTLACQSAMSAAGMITTRDTMAPTLREEQLNAQRIRDVLRRICVDPSAWIHRYGDEMVKWININMDPPNNATGSSSALIYDAKTRAFPFPELLAYEHSLEIYRKGLRPLAHLASIHPYHQVYSPSIADGKLFVSLFKWLSTTVRRERCWTVLDWNSQSGLISRSLPRYGVRNISCVDFTARGLKTTKESIEREIGPTSYTKLESTGSLQYFQFSPHRGSPDHVQSDAAYTKLDAQFLPLPLRGTKFDIIVTHIPMPVAAPTPQTDLTMHKERYESSRVRYLYDFLDFCESTLIRCSGRYVAIITNNYHALVNGEPLLHPLPEPTNWELIHREKCSLRESPDLLKSHGSRYTGEQDKFFLSNGAIDEDSNPMWFDMFLRDAAAFLLIFRLKGTREFPKKESEAPCVVAETHQKVAWKDSFDYHAYQPKEGPLNALQLHEIPTFSFLSDPKAQQKPSLSPSTQSDDSTPSEAKEVKTPKSRHHRRKPSEQEIARNQLASLKEQLRLLNDISRM
ncbi:Methylase protein [Perkinsela sp. CCAP 1560/4]|nr:Methylase protein [Perkinsela sp. CCAP 1560/4]|eukprot:KNH03817.1 Methylase protein [Perkinsela sp. CCAP 1560/4]